MMSMFAFMCMVSMMNMSSIVSLESMMSMTPMHAFMCMRYLLTRYNTFDSRFKDPDPSPSPLRWNKDYFTYSWVGKFYGHLKTWPPSHHSGNGMATLVLIVISTVDALYIAQPRDNSPSHPFTYRFECSKAFYGDLKQTEKNRNSSSARHQLAISSPPAHHPLIIRSSSTPHPLIIRTSSAHHPLITRSSSAYHDWDWLKKGPQKSTKNNRKILQRVSSHQ